MENVRGFEKIITPHDVLVVLYDNNQMTNEPSEHDETCQRGIFEVAMHTLRLEVDTLKYVYTQKNVF